MRPCGEKTSTLERDLLDSKEEPLEPDLVDSVGVPEKNECVETEMESLTSLFGNDQETIVNSLKTSAENGERIKAQKNKINQLYDELDKFKEEN